jgi:hypothetical protein
MSLCGKYYPKYASVETAALSCRSSAARHARVERTLLSAAFDSAFEFIGLALYARSSASPLAT